MAEAGCAGDTAPSSCAEIVRTLTETRPDSCLGEVPRWFSAPRRCWGLLEGRQHGQPASEVCWGWASHFSPRVSLIAASQPRCAPKGMWPPGRRAASRQGYGEAELGRAGQGRQALQSNRFRPDFFCTIFRNSR